jgi:hypothetical protein
MARRVDRRTFLDLGHRCRRSQVWSLPVPAWPPPKAAPSRSKLHTRPLAYSEGDLFDCPTEIPPFFALATLRPGDSLQISTLAWNNRWTIGNSRVRSRIGPFDKR